MAQGQAGGRSSYKLWGRASYFKNTTRAGSRKLSSSLGSLSSPGPVGCVLDQAGGDLGSRGTGGYELLVLLPLSSG